MGNPIVDTNGRKFVWIDKDTKQTYEIYAKTVGKASDELRNFLNKIGKSEIWKNLELETIKKIGTGSEAYENYDIGIDKDGVCYVKFAHNDWELVGF